FQMLKFSQKFGEHSTLEVLSSRNEYENRINPSQVWQYDEEILHRFDWWAERLNTTYGVNYRGAHADSSLLLSPAKQDEDLWSGYVQQSIKIAKDLSLSGGINLESANVGSGNVEPDYQVASLWSPWENHSFHVAYSVAHAVPSFFDTGSFFSRPPVLLV